MANELKNNEFKCEEDSTVVGTDSQGHALTHYVIAERLEASTRTWSISLINYQMVGVDTTV